MRVTVEGLMTLAIDRYPSDPVRLRALILEQTAALTRIADPPVNRIDTLSPWCGT